jgi:Flp pilus assembly protein TadG
VICNYIWFRRTRSLLFREDRATQIVEFAVSLPLLVVFVIGILDFSSAITLKQKLTNAARDGARVAAAGPSNDLSGSSASAPASVSDAFQVVDNYLQSEKINDCNLKTSTTPAVSGLKWIYTANGNGCPTAGITLTIDRGCISPLTSGTTTTSIVDTCVTILYPYTWQFAGVSSLFGRFTLPTGITTTAAAFNEN